MTPNKKISEYTKEELQEILPRQVQLLRQLRYANRLRCPEFGHEVEDWSPTDWATAVAGETGEMCNLIKKLHRGDFEGDEDYIRGPIGEEAADIVIYLDLLCQRLGITLADAIADKFNKTSNKIGSKVKIHSS